MKKLELANIATNESHKLNGFKVLGIFPFYLKYIRTDTHIQLARVKEEIQTITKDPKVNDFYDSGVQSKAIPLINEYCVRALVNNRQFKWLFYWILSIKIKRCSHSHILNLYYTILKLDEPAFFLTYWKALNQKDNTLLSEEKQSMEKSSLIKKKQA